MVGILLILKASMLKHVSVLNDWFSHNDSKLNALFVNISCHDIKKHFYLVIISKIIYEKYWKVFKTNSLKKILLLQVESVPE